MLMVAFAMAGDAIGMEDARISPPFGKDIGAYKSPDATGLVDLIVLDNRALCLNFLYP